jgi:hypothetical protein
VTLPTGPRLDAYQIVPPAGIGAIGEVDRERAAKPGRTSVQSPVLASLNHPHACLTLN